MAPERAFRNASALSFLLLGLGLMFVSLGLVLADLLDVVTGAYSGESQLQLAFRALSFVVAALFLAIGFQLVRARPRLWSESPEPAWVSAASLRPILRILAATVLLLGVLLLFPDSPYERNGFLASVLVLCGAFVLLATILWARFDVNVRATGAILGFITGGLLVYAQFQGLPKVGGNAPYGPLEAFHLLSPPLFGGLAVCLAAVAAFAYLYVADARRRYAAFLVLGLAALVYGLGLCLGGLAAIFDYPWANFGGATGSEAVVLVAFVAGIALLTAAGVAVLVASLVSFIRSVQILRGAAETPYVTTVARSEPTERPTDSSPVARAREAS